MINEHACGMFHTYLVHRKKFGKQQFTLSLQVIMWNIWKHTK